jgi:hypothetical protein
VPPLLPHHPSTPQQITRAAITTSKEGAVFDVFEIAAAADTAVAAAPASATESAVSAADVQLQVQQALFNHSAQAGSDGGSASPGSKRHRDGA